MCCSYQSATHLTLLSPGRPPLRCCLDGSSSLLAHAIGRNNVRQSGCVNCVWEVYTEDVKVWQAAADALQQQEQQPPGHGTTSLEVSCLQNLLQPQATNSCLSLDGCQILTLQAGANNIGAAEPKQ